jgi:hypothetical protein
MKNAKVFGIIESETCHVMVCWLLCFDEFVRLIGLLALHDTLSRFLSLLLLLLFEDMGKARGVSTRI